ncbi:hypothetical protein Nther_0408 [Natranaerobius thermophilus JW/NM-WN-LF]|uniref:Uncharacterized protein n=2 Tax=Natranaerobius TaxID=375928 RepID=B2A5Q6_NATTJ|nr:hypothetical protein Nther_0408 [Natranaerobius thermophilus JW/NM-WN-LF]
MFLVLIFLLMALVSGLHASKQTVQVSSQDLIKDLDPETAFEQGVAVDYFGNVLKGESGGIIYWNHPQKYFCEEGYLREKETNQPVITASGNKITDEQLLLTPELHSVEVIIHNLVESQ